MYERSRSDTIVKPPENKEVPVPGRQIMGDAPTGLIFDIQGHSVHDGPGTRTTVFMNGCPLQCIWCCNPEGLFRTPVIMYKQSKCVCCGNCVVSCPYGSPRVNRRGELEFNRSLCDTCTTHECLETCYHQALELSGTAYTQDALMAILQRDRQFWGARGGVTFSGGEPLMQRSFIPGMLKRCKKAYIHTCVETTSCLPTDYFLEVMQFVDWVFTDLKHMDANRHRALTGVNNHLILKNIEALAKMPGWEGFIVPRIPVIPGRNDGDENIEATADFIRSIGLDLINILPFHRLGESKYRQLGRSYPFADQTPPSEEKMAHIKGIIESRGLACFIGYDTPF
ncbi:MAG: glycyl-radical enzyme activating protein [Desulfobacter sp.]|nr:MAG: glycyl-radical enzyme activating protein [Desulfobacter sp.]